MHFVFIEWAFVENVERQGARWLLNDFGETGNHPPQRAQQLPHHPDRVSSHFISPAIPDDCETSIKLFSFFPTLANGFSSQTHISINTDTFAFTRTPATVNTVLGFEHITFDTNHSESESTAEWHPGSRGERGAVGGC